MDRLTKEQRHKNMIANKSTGTKIELLLAKVLWNAGIRYRKNDKGVHGTPDFTVRGYRVAIFCDGEFWHGRDWAVNKERIKSNRSFWYAKIERNIERDRQITEQLEADGWKVFRFWETDIRKRADECANQVLAFIQHQRAAASKQSIRQVTDGQKIPVQLAPGKQLAVVSHYLYNQDQPSVRPFEQPARSIIGQLYDLDERDADIEQLVAEPEIQYSLGSNLHTAPFLPHPDTTFTFVDLFAGIGGMRLALQQLGGRCVFCSEWNAEAQYTYLQNFGEVPFGDITEEATRRLIPGQFDLLCASIPSQRFSLACKKSALEKMRGTLFYLVAILLKEKQPGAFLLETDEKILTSDKGESIGILLKVLRDTLGYEVPEPRRLKASDCGLPQDTVRVYITGNRKQRTKTDEDYPEWMTAPADPIPSEEPRACIQDILDNQPVPARYYLSEQVMETLSVHKDKAETANKRWKYEAVPGNGLLHVLQGQKLSHIRNFVIDHRLNDFTVPTTYRGTPNKQGIRRLTPREMARLQGFPEPFILPTKDATAYRLLENASVVGMVKKALLSSPSFIIETL